MILIIRRSIAEVNEEVRLHANKDAAYEWEYKNPEFEARARLLVEEHARHEEF